MSPRKWIAILFSLIVVCLIIAPVAAQQTTHTIQPGENLFRIALRYGVGMDAIAQANGITDIRHIYAGQQLVIPNFDSTPAVVENPMIAIEPSYHIVQRGESLNMIAQTYGLSMERLLQSNNLTNPNLIYPGQQLMVWNPPVANAGAVPAPVEASPVEIVPIESLPPVENLAPVPAAPSEQTYVVQSGEHLSQIARRFGISWTIIAQANNIANPNHIYAGQTLIIPTGSAPADAGFASAPVTDALNLAVTDHLPPSPTIFAGKQVVVDLSDSRVYAYQDGVLLRDVLVSTGLPATPTVIGDFAVYAKYPAQTMSGPGYYLPDVPWVMYFYQGYGLHGTYWHSNWGNPMSHGCVNMPTPEADWLFNYFVDVGTPVRVQY